LTSDEVRAERSGPGAGLLITIPSLLAVRLSSPRGACYNPGQAALS